MQSLTVASFNLHWGRHPRSNEPFDVVDACRRLDADVLALQEVWRPDGEKSIAEEVAGALGYEMYETWTGRGVVEPKTRFVGRTGEPAGAGDWGQALLTRVPCAPVTEHRLDGFLFDPSDRVVLMTEIELGGETLTACASHFPHLEHVSPLLRWRLRGVLPQADRPAVLMGDFNMWRWVARFVLPGWHDTVRGPTWPARWPMFQIDHLFATPLVAASDAEVVRVGESDHLPIRARVTLPPRDVGALTGTESH
jgi:endonuclease/exonuclease/phosphatase family metal-dependent hydrolase